VAYFDDLTLVPTIKPHYSVTRDLAGAYGTDPIWAKGTAIVKYGQSGAGGIILAGTGTNSPYMDIFTHAGSPWSATTTRARIGNITGLAGVTGTQYGLWTDNGFFSGVVNAGGGKVILDANGMSATTADHSSIQSTARLTFYNPDGSTYLGGIGASYYSTSHVNQIGIDVTGQGVHDAQMTISASNSSASKYASTGLTSTSGSSWSRLAVNADGTGGPSMYGTITDTAGTQAAQLAMTVGQIALSAGTSSSGTLTLSDVSLISSVALSSPSLTCTGSVIGKLRLTNTGAGAPTGGTSFDLYYDTTNHRLYVNDSGTWKYATLT
jgi:hypothetical protein